MVQILDSLVPQKVEELLEVFRLLDTQMPVEQAIAVPKISLDRIPQRSMDLVPQMVEQMVEVPTVLTLSSLQQTAQEIVDIPVPRGRDRRLKGSLPRQSSTVAGVVQNVDTTAFAVFSQDRVRRSVLWSISLTVRLEVFKIFTPVRALQLHPLVLRMRLFTGFFRTFPRIKKKVRRPQPARVRSCPPVSAHGRGRLTRTWTLRTSPQLSWWRTRELLFEEEEEDSSGWFELQSASGRPFYWHRSSRRSLWHLPPLASSRRRKGRKKRKKRRKRRLPKSSSHSSHRRARRRHLAVAMAGFAGYSSSCSVLLCCWQAQDARHHGRYVPEGQLCCLFVAALVVFSGQHVRGWFSW